MSSMDALSARHPHLDSRLRRAVCASAGLVAQVDRVVRGVPNDVSGQLAFAACRLFRPFDRASRPLPDRMRRLIASRWSRALRSTTVLVSAGMVPSQSFKGVVMLKAYGEEVSRARQALACGDFEVCFVHLERAHVLAQRMTGRHTCVHWLMLVAGWRQRDHREVVGQVPRILASILFSRFWVPRGNTGRARVSALKPMPVPEDLRDLVA